MEERQALAAFGALSQETRLRLLKTLVVAGGDGLAAGALAKSAEVSASNVSFHLKELEQAGLVTSQRDARSIIYRASYDTLGNLLQFLMEDCCAGRPEICAPTLRPRPACVAPSRLLAERADAGEDDLRVALVASGLPTDDLGEEGRVFWRFSDANGTVAFGGYELHGDSALLRSIVVLPDVRGTGIGHAATEQLVEKAGRSGARSVYLLTTDAGAFFQRLGFREIERRLAPAAILATRQAAALCPASAKLMKRRL